ncbi:PIN domain-containing protein [Deinococcus ruber]|uniref:PIN domain-containing protein n=1 Tax=Deinococcus ruber TaxID=1848197 RepID=A0A918FA54_9DEIO|nr:PIN domain-containing protein [Deinococcus ruber]GGR23795.1 PIN domain-containing protein [Deinococcus ruber]
MTLITALYDASVLYPSLIRNLLVHLATSGLVAARWTEQIHDEWIRNLSQDRPELPPERLARTRRLMDAAVPDALVEDDQALIESLSSPDLDDRHVLAAAITAQADILITWNVRHFPQEAVSAWGIEMLTPDDLVCRLFALAPQDTRQSVEALRVSLKSPPYSWPGLLERFEQVGLLRTASALA